MSVDSELADSRVLAAGNKGKTMKRDKGLIRKLLLEIEQQLPRESGGPLSANDLIDGADSWGVENAHLLLLFEAGFIDAVRDDGSMNPNNNMIRVWRLTWAGYDFLDTVRDSEV